MTRLTSLFLVVGIFGSGAPRVSGQDAATPIFRSEANLKVVLPSMCSATTAIRCRGS